MHTQSKQTILDRWTAIFGYYGHLFVRWGRLPEYRDRRQDSTAVADSCGHVLLSHQRPAERAASTAKLYALMCSNLLAYGVGEGAIINLTLALSYSKHRTGYRYILN
jgi:hypothetical protein